MIRRALRGLPRPALAAALACVLPLAACQGFHFTGGFAGLATDDGWFELPVGRWLLPDGIRPEALAICPPERCGQPAMVARFTLGGREARAAERIAADPASAFAAPKRKSDTPRPRVDRARVDGWRGARVALTSPKAPGRAAHVVVLAKAPAQDRAELVLSVSDSAEAALGFATAVIRGVELVGR